jgi:NADH-quinone oxidoreductase subunit N
MLAYSSSAHAGYLLVALVAARSAGNLGHDLSTSGRLHADDGRVVRRGRRGGGWNETRLDSMQVRGLGWSRPLLGSAHDVFLLSLAGFPPTGGFIGKLFILQAAMSAGESCWPSCWS